MFFRRSLFALLLTSLAFAVPQKAAAYEHATTAEFMVGYEHAPSGALQAPGAIFGLEGSYGIADAWTFRARLSYGAHALNTGLGDAAVELVYVIDVFRIVPWFGGGIDALAIVVDSLKWRAAIGAHVVAGADYLLNRTMFVGGSFRATTALSAFHSLPVAVDFAVRIGWVFGN